MKNDKKDVIINHCRSLEWKSVARNSGPRTRKRHSICVVDEAIYLYGGRGTGQTLSDFWKYKPRAKSWYEIKTETSSNKPPPLEGHSLVEYNGNVYMFGGEISFAFAKEVAFWKFDILLNKWEKLLCNGTFPMDRREHVCVVYKEKMYVHGGYLDLRGPTQEMWVYDFKKSTWSLVESAMSSKCPVARYQHSGAVFRDLFYISGGKSNAGNKFNVWMWNFLTENWSHIRTKGAPHQLYFHSCCVVQNDLFVYGGYKTGDKANTNLWKISLAESYYKSSQKWKLCRFTNKKPLLALGTCRMGGVLRVVTNKTTRKPGYQPSVKFDFHKEQQKVKNHSCQNASICSSALSTKQTSSDQQCSVSKNRKYGHLNDGINYSATTNIFNENGFSAGGVAKANVKVSKGHASFLPAHKNLKFLYTKKRDSSADEFRSPLIQKNCSYDTDESQRELISPSKSKAPVAKPANINRAKYTLIDVDSLSVKSLEGALEKLQDQQTTNYRRLSPSKSFNSGLNSEQCIASFVHSRISDLDFAENVNHDSRSSVSLATGTQPAQQHGIDEDTYSNHSNLLISWSSNHCIAAAVEENAAKSPDLLHPNLSDSLISVFDDHWMAVERGPKSSSSPYLDDPLVDINGQDDLSDSDLAAQKIQSLAETYYSNSTILEQADQNLNDVCNLDDSQRCKLQTMVAASAMTCAGDC